MKKLFIIVLGLFFANSETNAQAQQKVDTSCEGKMPRILNIENNIATVQVGCRLVSVKVWEFPTERNPYPKNQAFINQPPMRPVAWEQGFNGLMISGMTFQEGWSNVVGTCFVVAGTPTTVNGQQGVSYKIITLQAAINNTGTMGPNFAKYQNYFTNGNYYVPNYCEILTVVSSLGGNSMLYL